MTEYSTPLVSVCIITYNHEKYIRQSIDSILAQETEFPIEILIGDDSSTDSTKNIVLEFEKNHPSVIRVIRSQTNLGANKNIFRTIEQCRGKYIALLEGDDFWTSTQKLQKQVHFMENNPDCTICFHKVEVYIEENDDIRGCWPEKDPLMITTIEDLIKSNYIPTCSVMYRNIQIENMPETYYELKSGDWPLHIKYAQKGKIGFINEALARYRIHSAGVFSKLSMIQKFEVGLSAREFIYPLISKELRKTLGPIIIEYCRQIAQMSLENMDTIKARSYLKKGMSYLLLFRYYEGRYIYFDLFVRVFFPKLSSFLSKLKHKATV